MDPNSQRLGTRPPGYGLGVGERAPDAQVHDPVGRPVRLSEAMRWGPVLFVFYRGSWCPFCVSFLRALTGAEEAFRTRGVTVVCISAESAKVSTSCLPEVPFPMLDDASLAAHEDYGVQSPDGPYAVPAFFLVDTRGAVRWSHVCNDFRSRPTPEQLVSAIDAALRRDAFPARSD